jgi:hypothetical protein
MLDDTAAHLSSEFAAILQRGEVCLNLFTVDALACSASKAHAKSLTVTEFAEQFGVHGAVVPMDDDVNVGLQLPVCVAPVSLLHLQDMCARTHRAVDGYKRVWEGMVELNQARGSRVLLSLMQNLLLVRANTARAPEILEHPDDCKAQLLQLVTDTAQSALHMQHLGADLTILCFPPKLRPLRESRLLSTVPRRTQDDFFSGAEMPFSALTYVTVLLCLRHDAAGLMRCINFGSVRLLYSAVRDGFSSRQFHTRCEAAVRRSCW